MRRNLKYSIRFGDENDLALTHGMSLQGGQVVCDWYDIEGEGRRIRYLPGELAELRAAIDEMLRMAEQHRDALTDGAEQQLPGPEPYLESVCGDPFVDPRLRVVLANEVEDTGYNTAQLRILRALAHGHHVSENVYTWKRLLSDGPTEVSHADFAVLHNDDLVTSRSRPADKAAGFNYYTITEAGRAVLAKHPDPQRAETERAVTFTDVEHNVLLTMAAAGITLRLGDPGFLALFNAGFIQVTDESMSRPTANREYAITARGRARLAPQTPEVESEAEDPPPPAPS